MSDAYKELEREILGDQAPVEPEPEKAEEDLETDSTPEAEESNAESEETEVNDESVPEIEEIQLPETIKEYAEATGMDTEFVYGLKVGLGDGIEPKTVGELKDMYKDFAETESIRQGLSKQSEELAAQRAEIEQLRTQAMTMPAEVMQAQAEVLRLDSIYQNTNWAELEANDPAQAALQKQNLMMAHAQAQNTLQLVQGQVAQKQQEERNQALAGYSQRLNEAIPDWSSQKDVELTQFMLDEGIPAHVIEQIPFTDSGEVVVKLMDELRSLRAEKSSADATVKKVQRKPISLKTGASGKKQSSKLRKLDAIIDQAKGKPMTRKELEAAEAAVFERYS